MPILEIQFYSILQEREVLERLKSGDLEELLGARLRHFHFIVKMIFPCRREARPSSLAVIVVV